MRVVPDESITITFTGHERTSLISALYHLVSACRLEGTWDKTLTSFERNVIDDLQLQLGKR